MVLDDLFSESRSVVTRRGVLRYAGAGVVSLGGCLGTDGSSSPASPTETRTQAEELCRSDPAIESDDPLAVSYNSRERLKCRGEPFENFERSIAWETEAGRASIHTENVASGSQAVKLEASRNDDRVRIARRFESGIDLTDRDLSLAARLETPDQEALLVQLLAPDRENRLLLKHPIQRRWGWTRMDLGPVREIGDPDLSDVREIRVGAYTGGDRKTSVLIDAIRSTERGDSGYAILTFDDNKVSQYETAFPILERRELPGVAGVIPWAVGERSVDMTLEQVESLHEAGWDIVSHPQRESPLPALSEHEQEDAIRRSKQWLVDHGFEDGSRFIIWPFGAFDPTSLRLASTYHYLGFCGALCPTGLEFTGPLTVTRLNANDASLEQIEEMVDLAAKYGQILPITFHQVGRSEDQVSEREFERIVEHVDESDLEVVTVSELWEREDPE